MRDERQGKEAGMPRVCHDLPSTITWKLCASVNLLDCALVWRSPLVEVRGLSYGCGRNLFTFFPYSIHPFSGPESTSSSPGIPPRLAADGESMYGEILEYDCMKPFFSVEGDPEVLIGNRYPKRISQRFYDVHRPPLVAMKPALTT